MGMHRNRCPLVGITLADDPLTGSAVMPLGSHWVRYPVPGTLSYVLAVLWLPL